MYKLYNFIMSLCIKQMNYVFLFLMYVYSTNSGEADGEKEHHLLSDDMRREMLRQKWEKEEQEMLDGPAGPIHYANVQWDGL